MDLSWNTEPKLEGEKHLSTQRIQDQGEPGPEYLGIERISSSQGQRSVYFNERRSEYPGFHEQWDI